jgi:hypothetical protein
VKELVRSLDDLCVHHLRNFGFTLQVLDTSRKIYIYKKVKRKKRKMRKKKEERGKGLN